MARHPVVAVLVLCGLLGLASACTAGTTATDVTAGQHADTAAPADTPNDLADAPDAALDLSPTDTHPDPADIAADDAESVAPDADADPIPIADVTPEPGSGEAATELADVPAEAVPETIEIVDVVPEAVSACNPSPRPVILVHGVNGSSADYATMIARLAADGWPAEYLFAFDAADPKWGCNVDNAAAIKQLVDHAMAVTGQPRVDLVAHSMGTLSSRYYVKNLGGKDVVNTYVTLGGMHHGLSSPCWNPLPICVWNELCESGEFVSQLNADPATPGDLNWVSIYGTADETVPNESSYLEGAENIALEGIEHDGPNGLQERIEAYEEVKRVLQYPCW